MKYVNVNYLYMYIYMYIYIAFHVQMAAKQDTEVSNKLADERHLYKLLIEG